MVFPSQLTVTHWSATSEYPFPPIGKVATETEGVPVLVGNGDSGPVGSVGGLEIDGSTVGPVEVLEAGVAASRPGFGPHAASIRASISASIRAAGPRRRTWSVPVPGARRDVKLFGVAPRRPPRLLTAAPPAPW